MSPAANDKTKMPMTSHEMFPMKMGSDRAPKSGSNQGGKSGSEGSKNGSKR